MTSSNPGSSAWAFVVLFVGIVAAFPFFSRPPEAADPQALEPDGQDRSVAKQPEKELAAGTPKSFHRKDAPEIVMAGQRMEVRELVDQGATYSQVRVPDWAVQKSHLDRLKSERTASSATPSPLERLPEIPPWIDDRLQTTEQATPPAIESTVASPWQKDSHQPENQPLPSTSAFNDNSDDWPAESLIPTNARPVPNFSNLAEFNAQGSADSPKSGSRLQLQSRGGFSGSLTAVAKDSPSPARDGIRHAEASIQRQALSHPQQVADRKRRFVYQPGYHPD